MKKEIKYAENVTLTVDITDEMVRDFIECERMLEEPQCDGKECKECSINIDILDGFGLCDVPEIREELERRCQNEQ